MKDRHIRADGFRCFSGSLVILLDGESRRFLAILIAFRIEPVRFHEIEAPASAGLVLQDDIQKNPVAIGKQPHGFTNLVAEIIEIGAVKIQKMIPRVEGSRPTANGPSVLVDLPPARLLISHHLVEPGRKVDRCIDSCLLGGVILLA